MILIDDGVNTTKRIKLSLSSKPGVEGSIGARVNRLPGGAFQSILVGIVVTVDTDWAVIRDHLRESGANGVPDEAPSGPLAIQQSSIGEEAERRR